jgi:DNA-binding NtrC family response regulator
MMTKQKVEEREKAAPAAPRALIVDDDADFRAAMAELVQSEGFAVETAGSLKEARAHLERQIADLLLVDLTLPDGTGLDLVADLDDTSSEMILITGHASVDSAVEALRHGVSDYLTKPVDMPRLKAILVNVARRRELNEEIEGLRAELRDLGRFGSMIGASEPMQQVYDLIARVAPTNAVVFIQGASGTGKELVAETLHRLSRRRKKSFVALNCGAVAPQLIESQLFGHERGSFTGADRLHKGYFERANGGTLFLDEITEMPIELQVKLLRVLETGKVTRIGGESEISVDVRVLAATNRDPREAVAEGKLREDLLYRLSVFPIVLPVLRNRPGDIDLLAEAFLGALNRESESRKRFSRAAIERLRVADWPGNVRQLKNTVERAFILADDEITPGCLPEPFAADAPAGEVSQNGASGGSVRVTVGSSIAEAERQLILATLDSTEGDKEAAAKTLGISLKTLYNRLNTYKSRLGS